MYIYKKNSKSACVSLHIHSVALKNDIDTRKWRRINKDFVNHLLYADVFFVLKKIFKKIGDVGLIVFENFENLAYSCTLQTCSTFGIH